MKSSINITAMLISFALMNTVLLASQIEIHHDRYARARVEVPDQIFRVRYHVTSGSATVIFRIVDIFQTDTEQQKKDQNRIKRYQVNLHQGQQSFSYKTKRKAVVTFQLAKPAQGKVYAESDQISQFQGYRYG